jgi:hypothetical protein
MVFLHEVECQAIDVRPTNDVDLVVDLRVEPTVLDHIHNVLTDAAFEQELPGPEGVDHIDGRAKLPSAADAPSRRRAPRKRSLEYRSCG